MLSARPWLLTASTYVLSILGLSAVAATGCSVANAPDDPVEPATGGGATGGAGGDPSGGGGASAVCGNGDVEASEECDEGGETDTCNDDCTTAACGDGKLNATAGETCDEGMATATCDDDCTTPGCGDGSLNMLVGEECDDAGESATCDDDCTLALCADAIVNVSAGEECEDGNVTGGDGCSPDCLIEGSCVNPQPIALTPQSGSLVGSAAFEMTGISQVPAAACDGMMFGNGTDRVFEITLPDQANLRIDALSEIDVALRLLTAPCDPAQDVAEDGVGADGCSDVGGPGGLESLFYPGLAGGTYYILVQADAPMDVGSVALNVNAINGTSCLDLLNKSPGLSDGPYYMDPDGGGVAPGFVSYCDMDDDLGGWTFVGRFSDADAANWMLDTGEWWYDRIQEFGLPDNPTDNADAISAAFWTVNASEFKITRSDNPTDEALLRTTGFCVGGGTFRQRITSFGNFRNGNIWGMDSVAFTCSAAFGNNFAATQGFAQATCSPADIGAPNTISFWSDWSQGDGAVIMIGGGGNSCNRADHGIGVTEANDASFVFSTESDFGNDGFANDPGYALNMFVR